jgi:hypothetical protein
MRGDLTLYAHLCIVAVYFAVKAATSGPKEAIDKALLLAVGISLGGLRITSEKAPEITLEQFSKVAAQELGFNPPRESGSKNRIR